MNLVAEKRQCIQGALNLRRENLENGNTALSVDNLEAIADELGFSDQGGGFDPREVINWCMSYGFELGGEQAADLEEKPQAARKQIIDEVCEG